MQLKKDTRFQKMDGEGNLIPDRTLTVCAGNRVRVLKTEVIGQDDEGNNQYSMFIQYPDTPDLDPSRPDDVWFATVGLESLRTASLACEVR